MHYQGQKLMAWRQRIQGVRNSTKYNSSFKVKEPNLKVIAFFLHMYSRRKLYFYSEEVCPIPSDYGLWVVGQLCSHQHESSIWLANKKLKSKTKPVVGSCSHLRPKVLNSFVVDLLFLRAIFVLTFWQLLKQIIKTRKRRLMKRNNFWAQKSKNKIIYYQMGRILFTCAQVWTYWVKHGLLIYNSIRPVHSFAGAFELPRSYWLLHPCPCFFFSILRAELANNISIHFSPELPEPKSNRKIQYYDARWKSKIGKCANEKYGFTERGKGFLGNIDEELSEVPEHD